MCCCFVNTLTEILETHIPHYDKIIKTKDMPWFTPAIKKAVNVRCKLYKKMMKSRTADNVNKFKESVRTVRELVSAAKNRYHDRLCKSLSENSSGSKNYWHILKQLLGKKIGGGIPTLRNDNIIVDQDIRKAELFLSKFSYKFHHELDESIIPEFHNRTDATINKLTVSVGDVRKLLQSLDTSKQGGEDGIVNKMLKPIATSIDKPLCRLFNVLIKSGTFPEQWKMGIVVPIFKNKGSKILPDNYRPITLLNSLSKIFERTVYEAILSHLRTNHLLFDHQSGFLPGHSTQKQLIDIVHNIIYTTNEKKLLVRGIFLDISGAFDAVPHYLLMKKLFAYGIRGDLLKLLKSYLSGRQIRVRVGSSLSSSSTNGYINCGVPQGSILGPLLFLIYINDVADVIENCELYMYADDCSLFLPADPSDLLTSTRLLQDDLDRLSDWSNTWKLDFKAEKSMEVIFRSTRQTVPGFSRLHLANNVIPVGSSHKHLGLLLDEKLSFDDHLTKVISKCNGLLNPLAALKHSIQSKHLESLYFAFILPHLEYGSVIFSSANVGLLAKLDQIHYRAALIVSGCLHGSNTNKVFNCLGWASLEQRRKEKQLLLVYEAENGDLPSYVLDKFLQFRRTDHDNRLRNQITYRLPTRMSQRFQKSTIPNSIKQWSTLPTEIKESYTKNSFKYRVKLHLHGKKNNASTTKLNLPRKEEVLLNRARCDLIYKSHLFAHNFTNICEPSCTCGNRCQNTCHVLFHCPTLNALRHQLFTDLELLPNFTPFFSSLRMDDRLQIFLFGTESLSREINSKIFACVSRFILQSYNILF